MTLLVFGKTGQVARELQRLLPQAHFLGRDEADLANPAACAAAIAASNAAAVINAAAWTAVDKAETEEAAATMVNGTPPPPWRRPPLPRASPSFTSRPITSLTVRAVSLSPPITPPRP
jgi:dTDP-4-dehydrorhamnose reductase